MIDPRNRIAATALAAAMFAAGSAPALAQSLVGRGPVPDDPVLQLAEQDMPTNQFVLNNRRDDEVVRFKKAKVINVCDARPSDAIGSPDHAYPIKVKWNGRTHVIEPGSCRSVDASKLAIRADAPIGQNSDLVGTVRMHG